MMTGFVTDDSIVDNRLPIPPLVISSDESLTELQLGATVRPSMPMSQSTWLIGDLPAR